MLNWMQDCWDHHGVEGERPFVYMRYSCLKLSISIKAFKDNYAKRKGNVQELEREMDCAIPRPVYPRFFFCPSLCSNLYCRRTDYNKNISQASLSAVFNL